MPEYSISSNFFKSGMIIDFGGSTLPEGWLDCDGSAISRETYAGLFTAIGTTWGAGNGTTTFNLPDLRGRATIGAGTGSGLTARTLGTQNIGEETHVLTLGEMPAHTHDLPSYATTQKGTGTSFSYLSQNIAIPPDEATQSNGGDEAHNNMQPSAVVKKIIKT